LLNLKQQQQYNFKLRAPAAPHAAYASLVSKNSATLGKYVARAVRIENFTFRVFYY